MTQLHSTQAGAAQFACAKYRRNRQEQGTHYLRSRRKIRR
jgi:hypothetical protein